jgi:hypothetical protein
MQNLNREDSNAAFQIKNQFLLSLGTPTARRRLRFSDICESKVLVRPGTHTIERFLDVLD